MRNFIGKLNIVLMLFTSAVAWAQNKPSPQTPPAQARKTPAKDAGGEGNPMGSGETLFPAVVARVNGQSVSGRDLEQRIQAQLASIGNPAWKSLREDYRLQLIGENLGSLVANELIYQKAVASGFKATEAEVQAEFAKVAKTFSSDAEMNMQLANRGLDRAGLNKELGRALVVSRYVEENVTKKIEVSHADAQQYYSAHTEEFRHPDLVRTSHILILVPESATANQRRIAIQRAESLLQRAKKGEDFATLAKENSMDGSASQGGDIGFMQKGQLAAEYEQAAFALPVGGLSNVVRTQFGYHVIKVTEKKNQGVSTLEEIRPQLIEFMKNQKAAAALDKYVDDLRKQAKIEVLIAVGQARSK